MSRITAGSARLTMGVLGALAVAFTVSCHRDSLTDPTEGAARAAPMAPPVASTLPNGITETLVAGNLVNPTAMAMAPDGRIFVALQGGQLRVVKNGALLSTPFVSLSVNSSGERGLLGIAFDPAFATNQYIYLYYTTSSSPVHNRISRFTANGDVVMAGSETILLDLDNLSSATNHNGGALHFGPDGDLYATVGDNANSTNAQSFTILFGKVLRINADGTIPLDNPFLASTTGKYQAIWAMGLRNPFTFAFQPGTGKLLINDVGENTWEEIDVGAAGRNYGWPTCEGLCSPTAPQYTDPIYTYNHVNNQCAIVGGAFYNPPNGQLLPTSYIGKYFFADYCAGWIMAMDPATGSVSGFASNLQSPVDLQVGADGGLYYLLHGTDCCAGALWRIAGTSTQAPLISQDPSSVTVSLSKPATFTVSATGTPTLTYQWQRDNTDIPGATSASYTLTTTALTDNGASFTCVVTNGYGSATSAAATLTVTDNKPPTATITSPEEGTTYQGGQSFTYTGFGTDPETGDIDASAITWEVVFHHDTHTHPFIQPISGSKSGTFVIPTIGEVSPNVYYAIRLTVTDPGGLSTTVERDIMPQTATISLASTPTGAQLTLDGQPVTTPMSVVGVVGIQRAIGALTPQTIGGTSYSLTAWSDLGPATHNIATPSDNTTYTATFDLSPCTFALSSSSRTVAPAGGGFTVDFTTSNQCTWSSTSNAPWLTINAGGSGTGNGTTGYSVDPNTGPRRVGTMAIAGQLFTVTQTIGCTYGLNPTTQNYAAAGGSGSVGVTSANGCLWTAASNANWITVTSGSGSTGSGSTGYSVSVNPGPQRTGTMTIGGQTFSVTQGASPCTNTITPTGQLYTSIASTGTVAVGAGTGCQWTAASNAAWITVTSGSPGTGNGTTGYSVAANTGAQRTGTLTIAGQTFTITQGATGGACFYILGATGASFGSAGGPGIIPISAPPKCDWGISSNSMWIYTTDGSGTGNGGGAYAVQANTSSSPRTGSLNVSGNQLFTITQSGAGCQYTINPTSVTGAASTGATGSVAITTTSTCTWSATSNANWITITSGSSGTGNGSTGYSIASNAGAQRSGTVTIAGQTFSVTQAANNCSYSLNPTSQTLAAASGTGSVDVTTSATCNWTASSNAAWITITPGSGGTGSGTTGNGTTAYSVAANTGVQRSGSLTIAGQSFSITQSNGCTYVINPTSQNFTASAGTGTVGMTAGSGCTWTAASNSPWITVTSGSPGSGNGSAGYSVQANTGTQRSGSITVGGQTLSVTQDAAPCTFSVNPTSLTVAAAGASGSVALTAGVTCGAWTAASNAPWITVTSGGGGTGSGSTGYSVDPNTGPQRAGAITIGTATFNVTQSTGCTFALDQSSQTYTSSAATGTVNVTTAAACGWTASSNASWLTVSSGSPGTGSGSVGYSLAANTGIQRNATLTIGGQTFSVTQGAAPCIYSINPTNQTYTSSATTGTVAVTAGSGCGWTATSNANWASVTSGANGSGNGNVGYSLTANTGALRTGTLTIAGQTFNLTQGAAGGGCTYTLGVTSASFPASGGAGTIAITAPPTCDWGLSSNSMWIYTTDGSGTGNGIGAYAVQANTGSTSRSGSLNVAGQLFPITQAASTCTYTISPTSQTFTTSGGSGSVSVTTAGTSCSWTATSNNSWISVTAGASGTTNGTVTFTVAARTSGSTRTGTITIAGKTFTVRE